jgi:hypothetical protein
MRMKYVNQSYMSEAKRVNVLSEHEELMGKAKQLLESKETPDEQKIRLAVLVHTINTEVEKLMAIKSAQLEAESGPYASANDTPGNPIETQQTELAGTRCEERIHEVFLEIRDILSICPQN